MKFTSVIVLSLGLFIASCSAACDCKANDQSCLNKCVTAANACIVKCESKGDSCQQECISSNWPSFGVMQKDVLASVTGTSEASAPTGTESNGNTTTATGAESVSLTALPTGTHHHSGSGYASASGSYASGMKPSTSGSGVKPSSSPKSNVDTTNTGNTTSSGSIRQVVIGWSATLAVIIGTAAYTF